MKRWWLAALLLLSVGINIGLLLGKVRQPRAAEDSAAVVAPEEPPEQRQMRRFIQRVANELGLAGEKREQFVDLQRRYFRRTLESRRQIIHLRRQMRRNLTSDAADRAQAEETLEQLVQLQGELEKAFIDNYFDSRELLDPRQERKLRRFLAQVRQRQAEFMKRAESRRRPGDRRFRARPRNRQNQQEQAPSPAPAESESTN